MSRIAKRFLRERRLLKVPYRFDVLAIESHPGRSSAPIRPPSPVINALREQQTRVKCLSMKRAVTWALLVGLTALSIFMAIYEMRCIPPATVTKLHLSKIADTWFPNNEIYPDAFFDASSPAMYLVNGKPGSLQLWNWTTNQQTPRTMLNPHDCFQYSPDISSVEVLKTAPYLLVVNCGHLEVIDKSSFALNRVLASSSAAIAPDENFIAVSVRGNDGPFVETSRVGTWEPVARWNRPLRGLTFSPDGKEFITAASRPSSAQSDFPADCGVAFLDATSGATIREWFHKQARRGYLSGKSIFLRRT